MKPTPSLAKPRYIGSLAQLVERFVYTEDVGSSSLSRPTILSELLEVTARSGSFVSALTFYCFAGLDCGTDKCDGGNRESGAMLAKQNATQSGGSKELDDCEHEFKILKARLETLDPLEANELALSFAARLIETAAFDLAGKIPSEDVGKLIEAAVDLSLSARSISDHSNPATSTSKPLVN